MLSALLALAASAPAQPTTVGPVGGGGVMVTTGQLVHPAGEVVELPGRPVDMVRSPDGRFVFLKENKGVTVLNAADWTILQQLSLGEDPCSMIGLALSTDGRTLYTTDATTGLHVVTVAEDGRMAKSKRIKLPSADGPKDNSFPCGIALLRPSASDPASEAALVCLSRNNSLGLVDLPSGTLVAEMPVGVAPFAVVLSPDQALAYVSDWGGRRPTSEERSATSAGTAALIDARGIAASGGVSIVDLVRHKEIAYVEAGLSCSGLALTRDGATLFAANANNDTVSVIDTAARKVVRHIVVKPDAALPFGSMPAAVALSPDEKTLYVACAGNNAVAVISLAAGPRGEPVIAGWIPTGWYPGTIIAGEQELLIANIKGVGSRTARADGALNSRRHRGSVQRVPLPATAALAAMSEQVKRDARLPQVLKEIEQGQKRADAPPTKPVPIPVRPGEPSVLRHVIYIIKENRNYDQVFGDLAAGGGGDHPRGNGSPDLCIYGRDITPNHHALAEQFVLLDNYYCNGVLSADGHSWATEGNSTPYLERSFGGFKRSYTYGDDPLTYSSSGFIWDHILAAGFSFRNYGELAEASIKPPAGKNGGGKSWSAVYADWKSGTNAYAFPESIGIENLRRYSDLEAPGWNLDVTDQIRADRFIAALREFEKQGTMPNFIMLHLPNDHTNGVSEGHPTPRAMVADNDLALGRIVEAVSHSKFWPDTAMFINEDDPQDGWDHVDGHRSLCLVVSPWAKRNQVVSTFYNQAGVVHTIERIFGLTAVNQLYASSPVLADCFADAFDPKPYTGLTPSVAIDEMNPPKNKPRPAPKPGDGAAPPSEKGKATSPAPAGSAAPSLDLYALTAKQDFSKPDLVNDAELNLVLWHAAKGLDTPYPAQFAGAHGKGLKALHLRPAPAPGKHDDDDDD
jgi:YVTN family beta-propeller protein